jgi:hypothetical protein
MALLCGPAPGRSVVDVGCVWAVDEARTEPFLATAIARPA